MKTMKSTLTPFKAKIHRVLGKLRLFLPLHHRNQVVLHRKISQWIFFVNSTIFSTTALALTSVFFIACVFTFMIIEASLEMYMLAVQVWGTLMLKFGSYFDTQDSRNSVVCAFSSATIPITSIFAVPYFPSILATSSSILWWAVSTALRSFWQLLTSSFFCCLHEFPSDSIDRFVGPLHVVAVAVV